MRRKIENFCVWFGTTVEKIDSANIIIPLWLKLFVFPFSFRVIHQRDDSHKKRQSRNNEKQINVTWRRYELEAFLFLRAAKW